MKKFLLHLWWLPIWAACRLVVYIRKPEHGPYSRPVPLGLWVKCGTETSWMINLSFWACFWLFVLILVKH